MVSFDAGSIVGTADLDLTPFHAKLDEAEARAERFESHTILANLGIEDGEALRRLADMDDRLDRYSARRDSASVSLDISPALRDVVRLNAELDALTHNRTINIRESTSGGTSGASGLGFGFPGGLAGLAGGAAVLGGPLGAVAGGGLLGIAGAGAVAGAGGGAFLAGALPTIKAVTTAQTQLTAAQKAYTLAQLEGSKSGMHDALAKQKLILDGLTASERAALGPLGQLHTAWKAYQAALAPQALSLFTAALHTAADLLPVITPFATAAGTALGGLFHEADKAVKSSAFRHTLTELTTQVGPDITALGHVVGNLGTALVHAFTGASPLIRQVLGGLVSASGALSHFTASSQFTAFVAYAEREGPIVAHDLEAIGSAAISILKALAPIGDEVLRAVGPIAHLVGDLAPVASAVLGVWAAVKGYGIISSAIGAIQTFAAEAIASFGTIAAASEGDAAASYRAWAGVKAEAESTTGLASKLGKFAPFLPAAVGVGVLGDVVSQYVNVATGPQAQALAQPQMLQILERQIKRGVDPATLQSEAAKAGISAAQLAALYPTPTHRTDLEGPSATNPNLGYVPPTKKTKTPPPPPNLLNPWGPDPGAGSGGGGGAAANAQLVDYSNQISSGLAAAVKRGVPAVQQETIRLRDTILREFKDPAAAQERRQALDLLAQQAPKALQAARKNAEDAARVMGSTITAELIKAVQSGAPAVLTEITSLQRKVVNTLKAPDQAGERTSLLAYLGHQLVGLQQEARQLHTLTTQLTTDKDRLTQLQGQATQFHDSAYGSLSGGASLTSALSSGQGITNYLGNQLSMLQSFAGELTQLKAAGIGNAALEMVVAAGPVQGGQIAKALLSSGTTGKASSLVDAIQGLAGQTATDEETTIYSPQLDSLNAKIDASNAALANIEAAISKSAHTTGAAVAQGLTGTARTAKRKATGRTKPKTRASLR